MKIVFMGTPDFAVPCLKQLLADQQQVVAVFTQPDKPKGRHYTLTPPPVKLLAQEHGIPVFQPTTLRDGTAYATLQALQPDLIVVVAYGKILPQEILDLPQYGSINIHASLLPKLRGAAPIQWAILNGESETGVTAMQMDAGMDTGDILLQENLSIGENETAGELFGRLSALGAKALQCTLERLKRGTLTRSPQDNARATTAPILSKAVSPIDWTRSAQDIHNQIRGLSPWPVATTHIADKTLKIHASRIVLGATSGQPGEILESHNQLLVACGEGSTLAITQLQPENRKSMTALQYLQGNPLPAGAIFT